MAAAMDLSCLFVIFVGLLVTVSAQCSVPTSVRGTWQLSGSGGLSSNILSVNETGLSGLTIWNKTLTYNCFLQLGNYYVYSSEQTSLFDQYAVKLYFCWYLQPENSGTGFKLYELTDKILSTTEERAKAYLTSSTPVINDVCQTAFSTSLTHTSMTEAVITTVPTGI